MNNKIIFWCDELKKYWLDKNIDKIINLFDINVEYYETPFEKVKDLKSVWEEIYNQDIYKLEYRIITMQYNKSAVNYILTLNNDYICNMVYEIELNNENKCIKFIQWYMENKDNE